MVPPARSTPRVNPPRPLTYSLYAQATTPMEISVGSTQTRIRTRNRFMVGRHAFRARQMASGLARLLRALGLVFLFLLGLGSLFVAEVAQDAALEHLQPGIVVHLDDHFVLLVAHGYDGAIDAGGGQDLVVLLQPVDHVLPFALHPLLALPGAPEQEDQDGAQEEKGD